MMISWPFKGSGIEHNKNKVPSAKWRGVTLQAYSTTARSGNMTAQKPTVWIGSSRDDLRAFPDEVRRVMGFAINDAQNAAMSILAPRR
jgi:hypothetical protein